jgi:hypothetical protein
MPECLWAGRRRGSWADGGRLLRLRRCELESEPEPACAGQEWRLKWNVDCMERSSLFRLPSSVFRLPSSVFRLPSSIFHLPSSIFHLPGSLHLQAQGGRGGCGTCWPDGVLLAGGVGAWEAGVLYPVHRGRYRCPPVPSTVCKNKPLVAAEVARSEVDWPLPWPLPWPLRCSLNGLGH